MKDQFIAAIVTRESLEIVPLTPVSRVVNLLRLFHFQISKFRLGEDYTQTFERSMLDSALGHFAQLYDELFAPLREHMVGRRHLVFVPHGSAALSSVSRAVRR